MTKTTFHTGLVTIKDIAKALGISHTTVSRALNSSSLISKETKESVRRTADDLGYIANSSAKMMRGEASSLIGLVVPDIKNDFYSELATILAERCRAMACQLVLAVTEDDSSIERSEINTLLEARAAGIFITPTARPHPKTLSMLKTIPTVQLVRNLSSLKCDIVKMDDQSAVRSAITHLLELGHLRIAYIGGHTKITPGRDRWQGFVKAHHDVGLEPDMTHVILVPPRQQYGADAMRQLLNTEHHPTAVFVGSSELTIGALKVLREKEVLFPDDISVIGYGDPAWYELTTPSLSAVRLPVENIANEAAKLLFIRIESGGSVPTKFVASPTLILRGSTAFHCP